MPSQTYQRFLDSMVMNFDKWHDGIGYDLEALEQMSDEERRSIEELLIGNLEGPGDWRDVEALASMGTPSARAAVVEARDHRNAKVRNRAISMLLRGPTPELETDSLEELVVQAVEQGYYNMAQEMPTLRVKQALLECTRKASDSVIRVNAAGLLMYLCGQAPEPFDWSQRPFFLRFAENDRKLLQQAWEELRHRTGL
jgi:hypothetical protein